MNAGFADDIVNECYVIHALAKFRHDGGQRLTALAVLRPFPGRFECIAWGTLEQLDRFARIPLLTMAFEKLRLVVEQVQMTRCTAHEQLNHSLGPGHVVQADRLAGCRCICKHAVASEHAGKGDAAQSTARAPKKVAPILRLAKR